MLPTSPALPDPGSQSIADCHDTAITPGTIIPAWYGERLDLDYAIYTSFANAEYQAHHRDDKDQREHKQPDQDSATPAPRSYSSIPVDLITAVRNICERQVSSLSPNRAGVARPASAGDGRGLTVAFGDGEGEVE